MDRLKKYAKRAAIGFGIFSAGIIVLAIVLSIVSPDDRTPVEKEATAVAKVTAEARANATPTPRERFRKTIKDALGSGTNRDIPKITNIGFSIGPNELLNITVRFAIDDNLTEGFIKRGAKRDIEETIEKISKSGQAFHQIQMEGTFVLSDVRGNVSEDLVVRATYLKTELDRVNWGNFLTDNVYLIADTTFIHPTFRD